MLHRMTPRNIKGSGTYPLLSMTRFPIHLFLGLGLTGILPAQDAPASGEAIYAQHCASCHGKHGEGVPDEVDEPLHGERALPSLSRYIDRKMPEDEPELLNAEESQRVA